MKMFMLSLVILTLFSCKSNHPSGKYFCDQKTKTTVVKKGAINQTSVDINCVYNQLEFKGNNKVIVSVADGLEFSTTYELDNKSVRIKNDKFDIVLKMQDQNTLIGEGVWKGIYKKM